MTLFEVGQSTHGASWSVKESERQSMIPMRSMPWVKRLSGITTLTVVATAELVWMCEADSEKEAMRRLHANVRGNLDRTIDFDVRAARNSQRDRCTKMNWSMPYNIILTSFHAGRWWSINCRFHRRRRIHPLHSRSSFVYGYIHLLDCPLRRCC